jgi:hypothetical protein
MSNHDETAVRRLARRHGYRIRKSRQAESPDNHGGYMLVKVAEGGSVRHGVFPPTAAQCGRALRRHPRPDRRLPIGLTHALGGSPEGHPPLSPPSTCWLRFAHDGAVDRSGLALGTCYGPGDVGVGVGRPAPGSVVAVGGAEAVAHGPGAVPPRRGMPSLSNFGSVWQADPAATVAGRSQRETGRAAKDRGSKAARRGRPGLG